MAKKAKRAPKRAKRTKVSGEKLSAATASILSHLISDVERLFIDLDRLLCVAGAVAESLEKVTAKPKSANGAAAPVTAPTPTPAVDPSASIL